MKFRRKSHEVDAPAEEPIAAPPQEPRQGPFDADDLPEDGLERVDLGSLLIAPAPGRQLRLQVDEKTGAVQAVLLVGSDGALELRAFAAPRGGDLWSEVRPQLAAETAQRGGTATEREGRFGTELVCANPVRQDDGSVRVQPTRIIGVNGPRWLLRATLLGRPAMEPAGAESWEDAIAQMAVRRGREPMPVGEALPVVMPPQATRLGPPPGQAGQAPAQAADQARPGPPNQ